MCDRRGIQTLSPVFYTSAPKYACARYLAGAGHLSPAVLRTLLSEVPRWALHDTCRGCVCCPGDVGWLASAYGLCCAFVAAETRQHPLPLPGLGSKGASLSYMSYEINVATLFMVPRWRLHQHVPLLLSAGCGWIPLSCSPAICRRDYSNVKNATKYRLRRNPPQAELGRIPPKSTVTPRVYHVWLLTETSIISLLFSK